MRAYMQRKPLENSKRVDRANAHLRVSVNPDLPKQVKSAILALNEQYKVAFQPTETGLCKPMVHPPVNLKLKANYKQTAQKPQVFGEWTSQYATHLTKEHLKTGLLERAPRSAWSSRTHFALKAAQGERG